MIEIGTAHRDTTTSLHQGAAAAPTTSPSPPRPLRPPPPIPTTTVPDIPLRTLDNANPSAAASHSVHPVPSTSASAQKAQRRSGTVQSHMNHRKSTPPTTTTNTKSPATTTAIPTTTTTTISTTSVFPTNATPIATTDPPTTTKRRLPRFWQQQSSGDGATAGKAPPASAFSLRSLKQRAEEGVAKRSLFPQKPDTQQQQPSDQPNAWQVVVRRHQVSVPAAGCAILNVPWTLESSLSRIRRQFCDQDTAAALQSLKQLAALLDCHAHLRTRAALLREQLGSLSEHSLRGINAAVDTLASTIQHAVHVDTDPSAGYVIEWPQCILDNPRPDYACSWPEHLDTQASWFRHHFVGKPYTTLIRTNAPMAISVVRDDGASSSTSDCYRVIIRSDDPQASYAGHYLVESPSTMAPIAAAQIIRMAQPDLDLTNFQELSVESTILAGIEKELLRLDEIDATRNHKFGVLTVHEGQTTEEAWFANTGLSPDLERLLEIIGSPVMLRGYQGYAGGLDTRADESGNISYVSRWRDHHIVFHVAPLMPLRKNDVQQVHRKRHIGNDIVCLVLVEGNAKFDPSKIRSQFLHIFIVLQPIRGTDNWSVQVVRNTNVQFFGPTIPELLGSDQLRDFLLLKMINAKCAAVKSEKFARPGAKARAGILNNIAQLVTNHVPAPTPSPPALRSSADLTPTASRSTLLRGLTRRRRRNSGSGSGGAPAFIPEEQELANEVSETVSSPTSSRFRVVSNMINRGREGSSSNSSNSISRSKTCSRRPVPPSSLKRNNTAKTS